VVFTSISENGIGSDPGALTTCRFIFLQPLGYPDLDVRPPRNSKPLCRGQPPSQSDGEVNPTSPSGLRRGRLSPFYRVEASGEGRSSPCLSTGYPGEGEGINDPRGRIDINPSLFLSRAFG
jgi:hypothetical protein